MLCSKIVSKINDISICFVLLILLEVMCSACRVFIYKVGVCWIIFCDRLGIKSGIFTWSMTTQVYWRSCSFYSLIIIQWIKVIFITKISANSYRFFCFCFNCSITWIMFILKLGGWSISIFIDHLYLTKWKSRL